MRRVYLIWFAKKLLSPMAVKFYLLLGLFVRSLSYVSPARIIGNSPSLANISQSYQFYGTALAQTEVAVQASLIIALLLVVWMFRDFFAKNSFSF